PQGVANKRGCHALTNRSQPVLLRTLNVACGAAQVIRMLTHYKHPLDDPDDLEGLAWVATELVAAMELMKGCFADLHRLAGGSAERHQG
ncbi:hypothetical protein ACJ41P_33735, partial [Azospirillum argentinense]